MKICTADEMRKIDRHAVDIGRIPSIILMENAAFSCVREIERKNPKRVGIFCGKGNNGGDGFAIARHLIQKGYDTEIFLVCGTDFSNDAEINYEILEKMGAKITQITSQSPLEYYILAQDLIVDAIFGTGISGEITGLTAHVIDFINKYKKEVLSVDIPSGVNADTGEVLSVAVKADTTVTFAAYKKGMILYPGAEYTGEIIVSDISIPDYIIEGADIDTELIDFDFAKKHLPKRAENSHKGDYGKVFIVGSSPGMTGAVTLSAKAAMNSGAGLVTAGIPKSLNPIMEVKLTEEMTLPLSEDNGILTLDAFSDIMKKSDQSDVLLFGVGIGRNDKTRELLFQILKHSKIPVVLDADALFLLAGNLDILNSCSCNLIFTPHEMEFSRLLGCDISEVSKNRLELSKQFATDYGVTLILKGPHTIVTAPDGRQYVNSSGNSGLATGGSGDVLAGMVATFLSSGLDEPLSSALAVYLHGIAGDLAACDYGEASLTAGKLCEYIGNAISYITSGNK